MKNLAKSIKIYHSSIRKWKSKVRRWERSYSPDCSHCNNEGDENKETELHLYYECPGIQPLIQDFIDTIAYRIALATGGKEGFKHLWMTLGAEAEPPSSRMLTNWLLMGYQPARLDQVLQNQDQDEPHFKDQTSLFGLADALAFQRHSQN